MRSSEYSLCVSHFHFKIQIRTVTCWNVRLETVHISVMAFAPCMQTPSKWRNTFRIKLSTFCENNSNEIIGSVSLQFHQIERTKRIMCVSHVLISNRCVVTAKQNWKGITTSKRKWITKNFPFPISLRWVSSAKFVLLEEIIKRYLDSQQLSIECMRTLCYAFFAAVRREFKQL